MDTPRILMAGCGALGSRIGLALAQDYRVYGLRRQADQVPAPLIPIQADLQKPRELAAALPDADVVIVCLTPDEYSEDGYRRAFVEGLDKLLSIMEERDHTPQRVFFISSTAVYGQKDDEWVNEQTPTQPARYNGQVLLEAEARLHRSTVPGTVVRFSGIYGNDRRGMLRQITEGRVAPNPQAGFTNRIHEDDCVGILKHLVGKTLAREPVDDLYLGSDHEPARLGDVVIWVRDHTRCAPVRDDAKTTSRAGSKRCDNRRIVASGYVFRYPTFREGYREMF